MSEKDIGDVVPPKAGSQVGLYYLPATSMLCVLQWPKPW